VPTFEQAWLLTIAKNECLSRYRSSKRRRELEVVRDPQDLAEIATAPTNGDGRLLGVQAALTRLPEMQRRALLLREWKGHSYAEIADELSLSQGAVEALLFRARRALARELGEEERRSRKHALDLPGILAALKSLLGGSAGVKAAAVGLATVASVSVAVGRSHLAPAPAPAKPDARNVSTPASGTPVVASEQVSRVTGAKAGPAGSVPQTAPRFAEVSPWGTRRPLRAHRRRRHPHRRTRRLRILRSRRHPRPRPCRRYPMRPRCRHHRSRPRRSRLRR
jgi:hypothetical protein